MEWSGTKKASEISETLLELTAKALLSNDFDSFAQCFHVPHVIETPDRKTILKSRAALRSVFDKVVEDYTKRRITKLIRYCEVAEFRGPLKIEATHITHMMSGNQRVVDPFPGFSVLEFIEGRWQVSASQYAVDNQTTVGRALSSTLAQTDQRDLSDPAADKGRMN